MAKLILRTALLLSLFGVVTFTACDKGDDLATEETTDEFVDQALFSIQQEGNLGRHGCYQLIFPVTVEFPDATTATVDDYEALIAEIRTWKEANPNATERPSLVFPLEVISEDGAIISVVDRAQLQELRAECARSYFVRRRPPGFRFQCQPCFTLVFPITIEFPDGTTAEAVDRQELKTLIRTWKADNPTSTERPELVFPINVEMEDGTIVTVNSREELQALREECN